MFKRRKKEQDRKETECPEKTAWLKKAEVVSRQYTQLASCCDVLSRVKGTDDDRLMVRGGWKLWASDITTAGIDIEEVYEHIGRLARKRKLELEIELRKLDV